MNPLVTIGCVTNRPKCRDWLRWNLARQTYKPIEIITVDGSVPFDEELGLRRGWFSASTADVVSISGFDLCPGDLPCGSLRNLVIAHAHGKYITWMDDDDWYHPQRIEWLVEAIQESKGWGAGWWQGYLLKLDRRPSPVAQHMLGAREKSEGYGVTVLGTPQFKRLINGAAIYDLDQVKDVPYDDRPRASDGRWIINLMKRHGGSGHLLDDDRIHSLFTRHPLNTSPTHRGGGGGIVLPWAHVRELVGEAWGDTDDQFRALERALGV